MDSPENAEILKRLKKLENKVIIIKDEDLELGNISAGQATTDSNCIRTKNYIEVSPNTKYVIFDNLNYLNYINEYNKDKTYIKAHLSSLFDFDKKGTDNFYVFKTSNSTKYIKFRTSATYNQNNLNVTFLLVEL